MLGLTFVVTECGLEQRRTHLTTPSRRIRSVPRGLLGIHALDVLSQTPGIAESSRFPNVVDNYLLAGISLSTAEILLCVRFVVVVLVLTLL